MCATSLLSVTWVLSRPHSSVSLPLWAVRNWGWSSPRRCSSGDYDTFMDVDTSRWHWKEGDEEVPIVLPRNYLNLYNFGFASSQGLPALSESLVSMVKIRFILRGSAGRKELTGRVVAFSKKLNTILVPQAFMDEMNTTLSPERKPEPSRLIVTVSNPADERIAEYLSNHSYETEADDAEAARTAHLLRIIISIVLVVGLIISAWRSMSSCSASSCCCRRTRRR